MDQHVYLFDRRKANGNQMSESGYQEFWLRDRLSRHREPDVPYLEQLSDGRWLEIAEKRIPEGGIVVVHKDVTRNVLQEQEYHHLATHDKLTGLVNRAFFESSLEQVIDSYRENKNTFSVMFFDLDGFKAVNDAFGHEFGDYLLKSVSEKLLESLRSTDILARMGGDEFCALVYDINSNQELSLLAGRCLETVGESVEYKGQKASFGVSIGIACYPYHGQTGQMLIAQADAAMYRAKKAGKNRYRFAEQYED